MVEEQMLLGPWGMPKFGSHDGGLARDVRVRSMANTVYLMTDAISESSVLLGPSPSCPKRSMWYDERNMDM